VFWKVWKKTKWVGLEEMELLEGRRDDLCVVNEGFEERKLRWWGEDSEVFVGLRGLVIFLTK